MSNQQSRPLKGMADIVSPEIERWQWVERMGREVMARYDFREVRTPVLEYTALFQHDLGETTDVVQKEMYAFEDRGGRDVCLRPEGTAGVMRYVAANQQEAAQARLFYVGPMFRCENVQQGRRRQFHQMGVEAVGAPSPFLDAEVIDLQLRLLDAWGISDYSLEINTRGTPEDRVKVQEGLREVLAPLTDQLCGDCQNRLESNVLRVIDCKNPGCKKVVADLPPMTDFMSAEARDYLDQVCAQLDEWDVAYTRNPCLVRGLDYYAQTVWEISSTAVGAQSALAGGGRYRMEGGGKPVEGVGFAMGLERIMMALGAEADVWDGRAARPLIWLLGLGEEAFAAQRKQLAGLRRAGLPVAMSGELKSFKGQMKQVDRRKATVAVIVGEQELADGVAQVKDLAEGTQETVSLADLESYLTAQKMSGAACGL